MTAPATTTATVTVAIPDRLLVKVFSKYVTSKFT